MHRTLLLPVVILCAFCFPALAGAQRRSLGASPPTAPAPPPVQEAPAIEPVSTGLGPLQFITADNATPGPQALSRELQSDDDRTRAAALAAMGAPAQYVTRGHIAFPRSMRLDFVELGTGDEVDAILTVELDQHLVSAILVPSEGAWKRTASMLFAAPFEDPSTTPSTFLRTDRALAQRSRYRAIYHGSVTSKTGDFIENEAHVQVVNGHAVVTISFVSTENTCGASTPGGHTAHTNCDLIHRWLQADPSDPQHRFLLVTGSGHISPHDEADAIVSSRVVENSRLRFFSCQPFEISHTTSRFEPTAAVVPCSAYEQPAPSEHP